MGPDSHVLWSMAMSVAIVVGIRGRASLSVLFSFCLFHLEMIFILFISPRNDDRLL